MYVVPEAVVSGMPDSSKKVSTGLSSISTGLGLDWMVPSTGAENG